MANRYQKKTPIQHVRDKPGMYIGSIDETTQERWIIYNSGANEPVVEKTEVTYNPGLEQCVLELLVNASDHAQRCLEENSSQQVTKIEVTCDNDSISVYNNGEGIPIEKHPEHQMYIPEMIFGNLLTSSNYDDDEKRLVGGTNGIGAKATNIFSKEFSIDLVCNNKRYEQTFSNGMMEKTEPKITTKRVKDYTKITFKPDFKAFKMRSFASNDTSTLIEKRVYDVSAITPKKVSVSYNDEKIKVKDFKDYMKLHLPSGSKIVEYKKDRWEVGFAINPFDTPTQISFVNGVSTDDGGTHVDHVLNTTVKKIADELKGRKGAPKGITIKNQYIKDNIIVFIKCLIENPSFDSQTKLKHNTQVKNFGSRCSVPDDIIKKVSKLGIADHIYALAHAKELRSLERTGGTRRARVTGIPKLEDASWAGTSRGNKCTLVLTEGDSAKSTIISGLKVVGRKEWGVFPLKGKLLNVRDASIKKLSENEEIINIQKILGLQHGMKDKSSLRYGKIMVATDSDADGFHIKGLVMNYLINFWPEIVEKGFVESLLTPVVKVTIGRTVIPFYNLHEFDDWKKNNLETRYKSKYYKGLGTSTPKEAREYFSNLNNNKLVYSFKKEEDNDSIILAFDKKFADQRKIWINKTIEDLNKYGNIVDYSEKLVSVSSFVNTELAMFSLYNVQRSLPSAIDGLKTSQRKILCASIMKKLYNLDIKVAQLGGYVSEKMEYHHGEMSLFGAITAMGQEFVSSGNANLLYPVGQFGTRRLGGKDSASPRYIFTRLRDWVPHVFNSNDSTLLDYLEEDGNIIEPKHYVPVLPMILINGSKGIGTGWSCNFPCFNPKDIINNINRLIEDEDANILDMKPWYKGYKGVIEDVDDNKWVSKGKFVISGNKIKITELPIGMWTDTFKEHLDKLEVDGKIKSYENESADNNIDFTIATHNVLTADKVYSMFKLSTNINATNMVGFDKDGLIKKYESPKEILWDFYNYRLDMYGKRKEHMEDVLDKRLHFISEKARFIRLIVNNELIISKRKKDDIINNLKELEFIELADPESNSTPGFGYLLNMNLLSLTEEKIKELLNKVDQLSKELELLKGKTPKHLWKEDLVMIETSSIFDTLDIYKE